MIILGVKSKFKNVSKIVNNAKDNIEQYDFFIFNK